MPMINLIEGITQAIAHELQHDSNVVVFGEDVGLNGGVFRATDGLQQRFGEKLPRYFLNDALEHGCHHQKVHDTQ